jgi:MFS family permease
MAVIARRRLDTFGALRRHPNFRLYWVGALCSSIGTWMQTLAQGWLVYQLTGSALLLGTVAFLQGLPSLLLALVGGALTDRLERRRLMLATQAAQMVLALALAGLTLAGVVQVWQILAIASSAAWSTPSTRRCARASSRTSCRARISRTPSPSAPPSSRRASSSGRRSPAWWWRAWGPAGRSSPTGSASSR